MKAIILLFIIVSSILPAQKTEEESVKSVVNQLFVGMKNADSVLVRKSFSKNAILQTVTNSGDVRNENISNFIVSIAKAKKGSLDEKITFAPILFDGNLASVWAPYEFYFNEKFSHCGVNSFQLVKTNDEWKIQYIIDTRRKDNCKK